MVRIRERLAVQGDLLAERLAKDFTEIVNDAPREKLEAAGLTGSPPPRRGEGRKNAACRLRVFIKEL